MIHRTSYMEPPLGVVIQFLPKNNRENHKNPIGGLTFEGKRTSPRRGKGITTFLYANGVVYKKKSLTGATAIIGKFFNGAAFMKFKQNGYHRFNTGEFIYSDINKLPEEMKAIVKDLEIQE